MCQTCWVTPAQKRVVGADGKKRWKCNTCAAKLQPAKAATKAEMLKRKIFNKENI